MSVLEVITLIISLIGACSWLPELFKTFSLRSYRISANLIDVSSIREYNANVYDDCGNIKRVNGLLLLLMVDFNVTSKKYSCFSFWKCETNIALKDDHKLHKARIVSNKVKFRNSTRENGKLKYVPMHFEFPFFYDIFRMTQLITNLNEVDNDQNVRIIPCLLERDSSCHPVLMNQLEEINISLYTGRKRKIPVKVNWDNERCIKPGLINSYAKKDEPGSGRA